MDIFKIKDFIGGWYVGNFDPTVFKTDKFEVGYKVHLKDEVWDKHYHKEATEINFLISGKMKIMDKEFNSGDIFVIYPNEIADPIFLENCYLIVIKTPSIVGDKYIL